jgi:diguanylate cyclase (GGDEF)-like protein/PAS domain S-box-containing protein
MIYDQDGRPIDWRHLAVNQAFMDLTGFGEVVGRTITELVPEVRVCCPDFFAACARVASGAGSEALEVDFAPLSLWLHVAISSPAPGYFFALFEDVSERKKTEAALLLAQLSVDRSADMIHWLTPDGRIIYASDSSLRRLGLTKSEMLTRTVFDLDPTMTPDRWAAHWKELRAAGSLSFETVHVTKQGEVFPVEITANYLDYKGAEYNFAFTRDISERKRLEDSLRLTQLSVDKAADLIHWLDRDGRILYVSDSNCKRHGYTREELLRMTIFDLDPVLTRTTWQNHWELLRQSGSVGFESVHRTKSGEVFPVDVVGNYVLQDGVEYNFVFARDISQRKRMEQDLHRAKAILEAQNRELEETSRRLMDINLQLQEARDALFIQAHTDLLTGCLNRGAVLDRLREELSRVRRERAGLALAILDIDHFKDINDTYGHLAGDDVLREVVRRAQAALRPYDVFGRFGGEEFLVVIGDVRRSDARMIFERLRQAVAAEPIFLAGKSVPVTVSIGWVLRRTESSETLIRKADAALYAAKAAGRNRVVMAPVRSSSLAADVTLPGVRVNVAADGKNRA